MNKRAFLSTIVTGLFLSAFVPSAQATSNYVYKRNEYVTITRGQSPDGVYSIAAHGEGDIGSDNFNLHLMDGKTGKKIVPLAGDPENTWGGRYTGGGLSRELVARFKNCDDFLSFGSPDGLLH